MKKVLITGVCGMVGSHMADILCQKEGVTVLGTYYKPTTNINDIDSRCKLIECDVRYFQPLFDIVKEFEPDEIYHLAAQSFPPVSWKRPQETFEVNVTGTINVFEVIKLIRKFNLNYDPVVVVACSSAQYGQAMIDSDSFINEQTLMMPLSPYGVSKVAQDLLAFQYFKCDNIKSIRARIFNSTGPRKSGDVLADFTKRAVQIKKGLLDEFKVGNINTVRAITDVRDLVSALLLLAEKGDAGDCYNICGEKTYLISDLIDIIENQIGLTLNPIVDSSLLRPTDEKIIFGDSAKLKSITGWKQTIPIEKTIADMVNYWEEKV